MADLLRIIPLKKADSPLSCHLLIPFHLALGFCIQLLPTMLGYLYNLNVYRSCAYCHNFTEVLQLPFWVLETVSLYVDAQFRVWSLIAFFGCILNSCGSLCLLSSTAKEAFFKWGLTDALSYAYSNKSVEIGLIFSKIILLGYCLDPMICLATAFYHNSAKCKFYLVKQVL